MKEKIVYFLGAGFSAPLGLPVMSNFLVRSKDLYFSDIERHQHFEEVFVTIDRMGKAKSYYQLDLFNIEEILSLLEMEDYAGSSKHKESFLLYLRDVILSLTPTCSEQSPDRAWSGFHVTSHSRASDYAAFVATLLGLRWTRSDEKSFAAELISDKPEYSIVTLNYDLILENSLDLVRVVTKPQTPISFATSMDTLGSCGTIPLAKLHGSVEPMTIVPPTWNKVANEEVLQAWRLAYAVLRDATQIRFIGYSLPSTDTYVRYLLASAVLEARHLKNIDVICLDDTENTVRQRYKSLITFYRFRFKSINIADYLSANRQQAAHNPVRNERQSIITFNTLEERHEHFMSRAE